VLLLVWLGEAQELMLSVRGTENPITAWLTNGATKRKPHAHGSAEFRNDGRGQLLGINLDTTNVVIDEGQ